MKIAILGYGQEGKSVEQYFKNHFKELTCDILEDFTPEEVQHQDFSTYDYVFRSPSVPPLHLNNETSVTKYFFQHCPCPIIGVTATKGKGTTCSFIKSLLDAHHEDAYLVGNIGVSALNVLDELTEHSVVIYEMSSFQLWDLDESPHIAILGQLEPDHLNIHKNYADYLSAKSNITKYQSGSDYLIYYCENPEASRIANTSSAQLISYPFDIPTEIKSAITLPGQHNLNNAISAIAAVACYYNISPDKYLKNHQSEITHGLRSFHGLPHRLEFVREVEGIKFYDDNFSTNLSSTKVALEAFSNCGIVLILGGRDKTNYKDLPKLHDYLLGIHIGKLCRIILIGESGHELAKRYHDDPRYMPVDTLEEAVAQAFQEADMLDKVSYAGNQIIVLMSPAAASFDMFKNVYDRGQEFQNLVNNLSYSQ